VGASVEVSGDETEDERRGCGKAVEVVGDLGPDNGVEQQAKGDRGDRKNISQGSQSGLNPAPPEQDGDRQATYPKDDCLRLEQFAPQWNARLAVQLVGHMGFEEVQMVDDSEDFRCDADGDDRKEEPVQRGDRGTGGIRRARGQANDRDISRRRETERRVQQQLAARSEAAARKC
jgi:hypothetical protein